MFRVLALPLLLGGALAAEAEGPVQEMVIGSDGSVGNLELEMPAPSSTPAKLTRAEPQVQQHLRELIIPTHKKVK